jgi:hypothetical protein
VRVRVISTGPDPVRDWRVVNAETGELLQGVRSVAITADVDDGVCATIKLHAYVELDVVVEAELVLADEADADADTSL